MADPNVHEKSKHSGESSAEYDGRTEIENASHRGTSMTADQLRANINAKIANPLSGYNHKQLAQMGEEYVRKHQIGEEADIQAFRLGAILAKNPNRYAEVDGISAEDSAILAKEISNKWSQPRRMYLVIILCSVCAAVQGMGMHPYSTLYVTAS